MIVNGDPAIVHFAGLAPGFPGLYQINFEAPLTVPLGLADLVIRVGGQGSQSGVGLFCSDTRWEAVASGQAGPSGGSVSTEGFHLSVPAGSFDSSMQLLETGLFDKHGISKIGVAGHPEGSPDISDPGLAEALAWKNAFAERSDAEIYIATQFCFEARPIIEWDKRIRAAGNKLPIHIGIPGLATLKTLINHARACGVGPSMRFLTRQATKVARLMTVNAPDKLVLDLARYRAEDPDCGIRQVHVYPLGGMRKSAAWAYGVLDGDFELKPGGKGFKVLREIV